MAFTVTKDTVIGDVLDYDSSLAEIFFGVGMHCVGWPGARGETIEEAAMVHGVDWAPIVAALRARIQWGLFEDEKNRSAKCWAIFLF